MARARTDTQSVSSLGVLSQKFAAKVLLGGGHSQAPLGAEYFSPGRKKV